jgi:hypothetical protein
MIDMALSLNAFAAAIDALFADASLARDAVYTFQSGASVPVRVMTRRPDAVASFGDARLWSETVLFDLRVGEIGSPRPGDLITLGNESFVVQGEPVRDRERLVWTLEARPT